MVLVRDLGFLLYQFALYTLLGAPIVAGNPLRNFRARWLVAPVLGMAALSVAGNLAYFAGVTAFWIWISAWAVALICGIWLFARGRPQLEVGSELKTAFALVLALVFLILIPKWVGKFRYFVFQGNVYDSLNYLETASLYATESIRAVLHPVRGPALSSPIYQFGQGAMWSRPAVMILLAVVSQINVSRIYEFHFTFAVGLLTLIFLGTTFFLVNVFSIRTKRALLGAFAMILGFWGQYLLDLNALSQLCCMSGMAVLLTLVACSLEKAPNESLNAGECWVAVLLLNFCIIVYGELFFFFVPALVVILTTAWVTGDLRRRKAASQIVIALVLAVVFTLPVFRSTLRHALRQARGVQQQSFDWWGHFSAYLFVGKDSHRGGYLAPAIDFLAGIFGSYYFVPSSESAWVRGLTRALIVIAASAILAATWRRLLAIVRSQREASSIGGSPAQWGVLIGGVLFSEGLALIALDRLWGAGKAFSYTVPFFFPLFFLPLLWDRRPKYNSISTLLAAALFTSQIGYAVVKDVKVRLNWHRNPFEYPYMANRGGLEICGSKCNWDWDIADVMHDARLANCGAVDTSAIDDIFLSRYLRIALFVNGHLAESPVPISGNSGSGRRSCAIRVEPRYRGTHIWLEVPTNRS